MIPAKAPLDVSQNLTPMLHAWGELLHHARERQRITQQARQYIRQLQGHLQKSEHNQFRLHNTAEENRKRLQQTPMIYNRLYELMRLLRQEDESGQQQVHLWNARNEQLQMRLGELQYLILRLQEVLRVAAENWENEERLQRQQLLLEELQRNVLELSDQLSHGAFALEEVELSDEAAVQLPNEQALENLVNLFSDLGKVRHVNALMPHLFEWGQEWATLRPVLPTLEFLQTLMMQRLLSPGASAENGISLQWLQEWIQNLLSIAEEDQRFAERSQQAYGEFTRIQREQTRENQQLLDTYHQLNHNPTETFPAIENVQHYQQQRKELMHNRQNTLQQVQQHLASLQESLHRVTQGGLRARLLTLYGQLQSDQSENARWSSLAQELLEHLTPLLQKTEELSQFTSQLSLQLLEMRLQSQNTRQLLQQQELTLSQIEQSRQLWMAGNSRIRDQLQQHQLAQMEELLQLQEITQCSQSLQEQSNQMQQMLLQGLRTLQALPK